MNITYIIVALFSVLPAIFFAMLTRKRLQAEQAFDKVLEDMDEEVNFLVGNIDIPEEKIEKKFLNVMIFYQIEQKDVQSPVKIFDTSQYEKNHLIGLTYFVQPQMFQQLKTQFGVRALRVDNGQEVVRAFLGNCRVYQLKDGRWLWRSDRR
jgi:hypothetical protein